MTDIRIRNEGSIFLIDAESDEGEEWIAEFLPPDALLFCGSVVCEHRYINEIAEGMHQDGLLVTWEP